MSTVEYVSVPIETDPDLLSQDVFEYIQTYVPQWLPNDGNLDVRIISAIARMAAESRDVASDVPTTIFRYFGTNLVGLPSLDGTAAQITLTFTARDTAGYTVPGGTHVQATDSLGNVSFWTTIADAVIPNGSSSITPVPALAATTGTEFNNLTFTAGQITLVDSLAFVLSIASVGPTTGGVDAEDDATYLNRLREDLTTLSPRPIIPNDFAILSKNFAGVQRALAIDGYDQVANTFGNAKTITVYVVEPDGSTPPTPTLTAIQTYLTSLREVGFVIYVVGPFPSNVNTQYTAVALAGFDKPALKVSIDAAIVTYLDPANWGLSRTGLGGGSTNNEWKNKRYVRVSELTAVIQDVPGVDTVTSVGVNGAPTDYDLTMALTVGPVALPHWTSVGSTGVVS